MIELSKLVVFDYGLSDTLDGLSCLRNGIYILWLTSSPCDKNSGNRFRGHWLSCFKLLLVTSIYIMDHPNFILCGFMETSLILK